MAPAPVVRARSRRVLLALLVATVYGWMVEAATAGPILDFLRERREARREGAAADSVGLSEKITAPGDYEFSIEHGGLSRKYLVHVPASYDPERPAALLVSLHGGGGFMEYQASDANYGQITASEKHGFVVVFPNGYSRLPGGKFATWNAGGCCGPAKEKNVDDVGFLRQVIANLTRQLNIDRSRIYATGFSNGAQMALRLACEMPDTLRGVAAVAGTEMVNQCSPSAPVSVLSIHARNDDHSRFEGGAGAKSVDTGNMANATGVQETVRRWVARNSCEATPKRVLDRPGAYCDLYAGCKGEARVASCVTERGTHSWPGASRSRSTEPPSQAISANEVMWNFFSGRPLD